MLSGKDTEGSFYLQSSRVKEKGRQGISQVSIKLQLCSVQWRKGIWCYENIHSWQTRKASLQKWWLKSEEEKLTRKGGSRLLEAEKQQESRTDWELGTLRTEDRKRGVKAVMTGDEAKELGRTGSYRWVLNMLLKRDLIGFAFLNEWIEGGATKEAERPAERLLQSSGWERSRWCRTLTRRQDLMACTRGVRRRCQGLVGFWRWDLSSEVPVTDVRTMEDGWGRWSWGMGTVGLVEFQAPLWVPSGNVKLSSWINESQGQKEKIWAWGINL